MQQDPQNTHRHVGMYACLAGYLELGIHTHVQTHICLQYSLLSVHRQ